MKVGGKNELKGKGGGRKQSRIGGDIVAFRFRKGKGESADCPNAWAENGVNSSGSGTSYIRAS